ncbi:aldose epimerase [Amphibacillus cookii]|uniref:aldose epimerase family protein n=1 Tax=Amphibacillus cookii TaxID=767787 RepID=UPI00195A9B95|nr:aldose epimerase [Amphibacillus cookii]MBM7539960.1 galactose mutarotase-like enzyme [Amphibacillus cookii]
MYKIESFEKQMFAMYQLSNEEGTSWITVCPERGGIIIGYGTKGQEKLYLNEETLYDRKQNIRGGIPILFPISGQLPNGQYQWDDKHYHMPNHGLARIHPWEVIETYADEEKAFISILFESSIGTKEAYPFDFEVIFTYTLKEDQLFIYQTYRNVGSAPMPIYPGLHPYFKANSKLVSIDTDAKTYYDYNDDQTKDFTGQIDLEKLKEAVVLENKRAAVDAKFDDVDVHIEMGKDFRYTVLWSEQGKEFVCVEPWTAKTGELGHQDELIIVEPKDAHETWVSFQVV